MIILSDSDVSAYSLGVPNLKTFYKIDTWNNLRPLKFFLTKFDNSYLSNKTRMIVKRIKNQYVWRESYIFHRLWSILNFYFLVSVGEYEVTSSHSSGMDS